MTITDIARMMMNADQYQRGVTQPKYPNGAAVSDPNAPDDGLDITGMTAADFHIIPVSKEAEQAVRDIALEHMKKYYGMSGRVNPRFCVKSILGANRAKLICGGSRLVRLPPW